MGKSYIDKVKEIIGKYSAGDISLEDANSVLAELPGGLKIDPNKNVINHGEEDRFGLLDTGTGYLDKVEIKDMKLLNNSGVGKMYALCCYKGKWYLVEDDTLTKEIKF